jgi:type II secretory pathway component PulJ
MRRRRGGHSLVELLIAMLLVGTVLGTLALSLHRMFRAEQRISDHLVLGSELERLATQLRTDTHASLAASVGAVAEDAEVEDAEAGRDDRLTLVQADDRQIEYRITEEQIERVVSEAGRHVHRETYRLAAEVHAAWQLQEDFERPLIGLVWSCRADPNGGLAGSAPGRIQAAVGVVREP